MCHSNVLKSVSLYCFKIRVTLPFVQWLVMQSYEMYIFAAIYYDQILMKSLLFLCHLDGRSQCGYCLHFGSIPSVSFNFSHIILLLTNYLTDWNIVWQKCMIAARQIKLSDLLQFCICSSQNFKMTTIADIVLA